MPPELPAEVLETHDVVRPLGVGGQGRTYLARSQNDELVVLKALDFVELTSFKELDLFQREVKVLRSLDHPAIPKLLGHYPKSLEDEPEQVVIVQEYIEGDTLEEVSKAEDGPIFDEAQAREFLREMLELLDYLHLLNPPVVHRDIKPSNIIRRPDGSHALIDFGAARATGVVTDGSTFIGTNGYMAPEQLMGRARPSSDLFSLGATVLNLMTDIEPSNLALDDFSFRLTEVDATPEFRDYLRRLTHPSPARRYHDTRRALEALARTRADVLHVARDEHMIVERLGDGNVMLEIPRTYESSPMPVVILLIASAFVIAAMLLNLASVPFWSLVLGGTAIATWTIAARKYFSMNHEGIVWHHGVGPLGFTTRLITEDVLDVRAHSEADGAHAGLFFQKRDGEQLIVWTRADNETNEALAETIMRHLESVR